MAATKMQLNPPSMVRGTSPSASAEIKRGRRVAALYTIRELFCPASGWLPVMKSVHGTPTLATIYSLSVSTVCRGTNSNNPKVATIYS